MRKKIDTIELFPILDLKLLNLLRGLSDEEWLLPTVAKLWCVKDVATHLLDGNLRMLSSAQEKNWDPSSPISSYAQLVDYLNGLNADWVKATKRLSPSVLIDLLEWSGSKYCEAMRKLEPDENARFSVAWAGDSISPNWYHIAREYTEKWHHQQQIRDATNREPLFSRELYHPVLDTFVTALPYTYKNVDAERGTSVKLTITGEAGGDWFIVKQDKWESASETLGNRVSAHVTIDGQVAWKLFTRSWRKIDVERFVKIEGDQRLGEICLEMVSVMA
jgi:uncharacterized protein (TIGR03083 family)